MKSSRVRKSKSTKAPKRKAPITIPAIVGMLESSARLDEFAAQQREVEASKIGRATGEIVDWHGEQREVVALPLNAYSFGMIQSAQILAGQAAELALKYAFESKKPQDIAPTIHELDCLYELLSDDRKEKTEEDYSLRKQRHSSPPISGWQTAEEVFCSARDYPVLFRYLTEEGVSSFEVQPQFLREAVCSVLATLSVNVRWGSGSS